MARSMTHKIDRGVRSKANNWQSLKSHPEQFQAILRREKRTDFRSTADREFSVSERINLLEFDPATQRYTGDICIIRITHIEPGGAFGIPEGYVVLSIELAGWRSSPPEGTRQTIELLSHCTVCHHRLDGIVDFEGGIVEPPPELGRD